MRLPDDPIDALEATIRWAGPDTEGWGTAPLAPEARQFIADAWREFWARAEALLGGVPENRAAMMLWLTAQGHGDGFWNGDFRHGDLLTEIAGRSRLASAYPYVGDEGQLWLSGSEPSIAKAA